MIKNKIINHLTLTGNKTTGEKILIDSIKKIQKESKKPTDKIIQIAIINTSPIFKVHKISNKKKKKKKLREIPAFVSNNNARLSLAIKFILFTNKSKFTKIATKLKNEILQGFKNEGLSVVNKNELQRKALLNKKYLRYYRW